jgi:p-hydroxybenzoate 3-monooxygenase
VSAERARTQVGIVGGGPAGLLLGHLLHLAGIESVVLERRSRDYVQQRVRAGVLEQGTVETLIESGVGDGVRRDGLVHEGVELRFDRRGHRIDFAELTGGRTITIYGQQHVVADLTDARLAAGLPLRFEVESTEVDELEGEHPAIHYTHEGRRYELRCDVIAGCDGFHGICRPSIPDGVLTSHDRVYPYAWLGILAEVAPSSDELIYANHERGFALHSMRSPELSRLYIQCDPEDQLDQWPDERIWTELETRLAADGFTLGRGPIVDKGITPMRSFAVEPMQFGRLFLAGDAAHIVPPTGAKGLNLAVADVRVLAAALEASLKRGDDSQLAAYSATCLKRVWRVQHFSWWMTSMLHRAPGDDDFDQLLRRSQLEYVCSSRAASTSLAENYVGLPYAV